MNEGNISIATEKEKFGMWEIVILVLSIYVLVAFSIEIIVPLSHDSLELLEQVDFVISLLFLGDFFFYLFRSKDKWLYFRKRWLDLLSAIPFIGAFRLLRIARIVRFVRLLKFLRLLKGSKGLIPVMRWVLTNKLRSILVSYIILLMIVLFYSSLAFYSFEKDVNPNINEYFDAFWWAFITVTSVGYGDVFPITKIGKIIAMVLTVSGMGLFSIVTAELSAKFITYIRNEELGKKQ